ncbi:ShlB/FhaC/HecB family hemolysin secretion/activation protein [Leptodesmis sichuanensis]|uniref:ShlB/FhaC/HecB family hemolysin secretion/activation protein n=1 Tax=Leptodesmis sichuanensis TaxID=2906798 RepID=UPI001F1FAF43|nr:ShlB/FhaC/HecB family hemolysin secretion/activation protein [Leptodesmis sichuanensis]
MNIQHLAAPWYLLCLLSPVLLQAGALAQSLKIAQTPPIQRPDARPPLFDPGVGQPPSREPLPQPEIEPLPPPEQLLPPSPTTPTTPGEVPPIEAPQTIRVKRFVITGSTVFSEQELVAAIAKVIGPLGPEGRNVSLAELFQARSAVTDYYTSRGYITSGAFIPPQKLQDGVVEIRVLEGSLEDIRVTGLKRLNPGYISSRIAIATRAPLNRDRLLQALQLLQLNPLVASISAELSAGSRPGTSLLEVRVTEARSAFATFTVDNQRVPSVGSVRGQLLGTELNLLGFGDAISLSFTKTQGSNALDFSYTVPLSPYDTTLGFSAGFSNSQVIEAPFDVLNIQSESYYLELTGRQPIIRTPTQELALGLTLSTRRTKTTFLEDRLPFSSPGADAEGQTKASVIRFFQEYTTRSSQSVFAVRSQFNLGVEALGATVNESPPDTRFFSWRGQAQWVRLLAPDTILLVRGDLQLADRPLLPIEQFGIGGLLSVRGYRQDLLLTDNGLFASVETRIPVLRFPQQQALVFFTPFVDFGKGWNRSPGPDPDPGTLVSTGFGFRLQISNNFNAQLVFGFPLVKVNSQKETLQEKGIYFSVIYTP